MEARRPEFLLMTLEEKVIALVADETGRSDEELTAGTTMDQLGLDSLSFLELILRVRNEISEVSREKMIHMRTIGDIVKALA